MYFFNLHGHQKLYSLIISDLSTVVMAVANQQAKRDVIVSKDALLKSYRKRLKVIKGI